MVRGERPVWEPRPDHVGRLDDQERRLKGSLDGAGEKIGDNWAPTAHPYLVSHHGKVRRLNESYSE